MNYEELAIAARFISNSTKRQHSVALVLGSGLGGYAFENPSAIGMPYLDIPGFTVPAVAGHRGILYSIEAGATSHLVFSGRTHSYEGHRLAQVVFGVRAAIAAGCQTVVLTNAAGGVGDHLDPGDLVLITDHINLSGTNPLIGENDDRLGPRFPDMTNVYDPELRSKPRLRPRKQESSSKKVFTPGSAARHTKPPPKSRWFADLVVIWSECPPYPRRLRPAIWEPESWESHW